MKAKQHVPARRGKLSQRSRDNLSAVLGVLNNLRQYWPLTLRQIYYQLVAALIPNDTRQYKKLSELLSKARLAVTCHGMRWRTGPGTC